MKRCYRHLFPVNLEFRGHVTTRKGYLAERYVCPVCGYQQIWGRNFFTGAPRRVG